jgi:hypothetical protein
MENNKQDNNSSQRSNEEEIDLGQLFTLIGKGFSKIFNFFGNIFKAIFAWFLSVILLVKKNIITLSVSTLLGLSLGYVYQHYIYVPKYESSMNVKPNFGSTIQLYRVVEYYQSLVRQKDFKRLSENLNLTKDQAESIVSFSVEPYANKNQSVKAYGRFLAELDTSVTKSISFNEFIENQPVESFEFHIINVKSKDKFIFDKLGAPIISSIENNDFYKTERATTYNNLLIKKKVIESSIEELKQIQKLQKDIMVKESEKENGSGTNIYLGDTKEQKLISYEEFIELDAELAEVNSDIMKNKTIVDLISKFDDVGKKEIKWFRSYLYLGLVLGFVLSFSVISLIRMNSKLNVYEEKRKNR